MLRLSDLCGEEDSSDARIIACYDASAGWITGGGWFDSPEGSSEVYSDTGIARFGFVSDYNGNFEQQSDRSMFRFILDKLRFASYIYDSLDVSANKARLIGRGTLDGKGDHGFLISAIDGDMDGAGDDDKLRIKIWDLEDQGQIIYDNQSGSSNQSDPISGIQSGSIMINSGSTSSEEKLQGEWVSELEIYPNPFSHTTIIGFKVKESAGLDIHICDLSGKRIKSLFHGQVMANTHYRLEITASDDMQNGTYLIQFRTDNKHAVVRPLILLK
jgi:hypothetical protein